jgi:uncharacterized protein YfaS (alpha-2-macroglobulin family)
MRSMMPVLVTIVFGACAVADPHVQSFPDAGIVGEGAPGAGDAQMWPQGETAPTLRVDLQHYAPGATAQLRLHNVTAEQIGYNLCTATLERRAGDQWTAVPPGDIVCTMEIRTLEAGAQTTYPYPLASNLATGEYRVRARLERTRAGDQRYVVSQSFHVGGQHH